MGRKRWWQGGLELLMLWVFHTVLGDGEVGCRFSKSLCKSEEVCYDDQAFGKCIQLYPDVNNDDLYQYNLDPEELELLRLQLERLEVDGYRWPHPYTQCIMQNALYALRFRSSYDDPALCRHLQEHKKHQFRDDNEIDDDMNSRPIAIVKFTPSEEDPHGDFADELYYPPKIPENLISLPLEDKEYSHSPFTDEKKKLNHHHQPYKSAWNRKNPYDKLNVFSNEERIYKEGKKLHKKSSTLNSINKDLHQFQHHSRRPTVQRNDIDFIKKILKDDHSTTDLGINNEYLKLLPQSDLEFLPNELIRSNANFRERQGYDVNFDDDYEKILEKRHKFPNSFSEIEFLNDNFDRNINLPSFDDEDNNDDVNVNRKSIMDLELINKPIINTSSRQNGIYTEGGLIKPFRRSSARPERPTSIMFDNDLNALLLRRELAGFKRRERLDVKKPGPPFATNNFAFKTQSPPMILEDDDAKDNQENEIIRVPFVKKELNSNSYKLDTSEKSYKNVDMDHVYIQFKDGINEWIKGEHIVKEVGRLLGLNQNALGDVRVGRAEVTFKVKDNNKNFNASDVVSGIADICEELRDSLGVEVVRAGIGDKAKLPATLEVTSTSEMSSELFGAIVAAGAAAAGAAAVVTLIIARRHAKSRSKLAALSTPDPEASKDYQDLCRARMQAKQPTEKPDSPRIVSLSRESESNNSPSSRSSTSSWSEEPALSNMDISTGHMVLSYMEDHLKNKDRLDQEWTALCAYEAEPSSTAIAEKKANMERNRPDAALPYDHSRLVLNDLANINNSDYINASTITDHDPRNPAYIATQGPLPQTGADFWQLVWEQGSVVIVMLTRLTEEGRAMCHRYWPEEGSELYHIYEVHLVSEHIWCDDYLVRSFYLKNLGTGETRTVTQFHFLSWPENGVPHSTKALLEFRRKVNKSYRGRSCPIVVHCSDGAGRTGTYTLIDMVLNRMAKGAKEIDIAATLEHIRDQRPGMVATKKQFEFVLMAVAEEVHAILKALPIPPVEKSPVPATSNVTPPTKTEQ